MLLELSIKDFAIIDELRIPFEPGLNVLTGETGAGKSIIVDALGAVLGERIGAEVVRTGARGTRIEATFALAAVATRSDVAAALADLGVEPEDDVLVLNREVAAGGRSSARINGRTMTAGALGRLGALLVDIHGQSDHLSLLRPQEHLNVLDRYAGVMSVRAEVAERVSALRSLRVRMREIETGAQVRAHRVDLLQFQVGEIDAANLRPGEDEELTAERSLLVNAERLATDAAAVYALMSGDDLPADTTALPAIGALRQAAHQLAGIAELDESMQELAARLDEQVYLLDDIAVEVRTYRDRIEANPARLELVEDRLELIRNLKRKYGATVGEILTYAEEARIELDSLTGGEGGIDALKELESAQAAEIGEMATKLSRTRRMATIRLAEETEAAIAELNMGRARFAVSIEQVDSAAGVPFQDADGCQRLVAVDETGADRVEFLLAPNAGEALKPLARVASGGETARLMLALKSILSEGDATPTLVFDEVDVGVGGRSGQVVGEKLWGLSNGHQVIVITHLPQIAAFADAHFRISKGERDGRVVSYVDLVDGKERIDELAAMLDGWPVTDASRQNARQMIERVHTWIAKSGLRPATAPTVAVR